MTRSLLAALFLTLALPAVVACDLLLGGGEECAADSDCNGDDICDNGECVECENDRDCDDDEECNDGECESADEGEGEEGEGEGVEGEGEGVEGEGEGVEGEGEGGDPCASVPPEGRCQGTVAQFCDGGELIEDDCADYDPSLTCQEAFGVFLCGADIGDTCIVQNPDAQTVAALCADAGAGCTLTATQATCEPGAPTCALGDDNTCIGTDFVVLCIDQIGQPTYIPCADLGGGCEDTTGCTFTSGDTCLPGFSTCDGADCPEATGVCP